VNLDSQILRYQTGQGILLNVLQAIADWGNSISGEANALAQYNVQLATLERQTGTILETHGVYLYEERYDSIGPLGRFCADVCYPHSNPPTPNDERYGSSDEPAEESFNLKTPREFGDRPRRLPSPEEMPGPPAIPTPVPVPPPLPAPSSPPSRPAAATRRVPVASIQESKVPLPRYLPTVKTKR
jgi:hypothetical protein